MNQRNSSYIMKQACNIRLYWKYVIRKANKSFSKPSGLKYD